MGPYKRNWFVGGTVLLALITLGLLIILFGGSLGSIFAGEKIPVTFKAERADGLNAGASIRYLGQQVGVVKGVELQLNEVPNFVYIHTELDANRALPANSYGVIGIPNFLGSGSLIELVAEDPTGAGPKLKGGEVLVARYVGLSVLPPEFADLAGEMKLAIGEFREAGVIGEAKLAIANFNAQISKAGKVMDSIDAVLGTEATQTDLRTAIQNFREATAHAKAVAANFEKISVDAQRLPPKIEGIANDVQAGVADARATVKTAEARIVAVSDQLNRSLEKVAVVLDDMKGITDKMNNGNGTIALLLNDPTLYDKIVTGTEVITETVRDVQRVIQGFEQDGVPLKLR